MYSYNEHSASNLFLGSTNCEIKKNTKTIFPPSLKKKLLSECHALYHDIAKKWCRPCDVSCTKTQIYKQLTRARVCACACVHKLVCGVTTYVLFNMILTDIKMLY